MISANNITLRVGKKALFEDVISNLQRELLRPDRANGAGKSTFLKILSGQLEPTKGDIVITPDSVSLSCSRTTSNMMPIRFSTP